MSEHDALLFRVLGPVQCRAEGQWRSAGSPMLRTLLAILLASAGRLVTVRSLLEDLWPDVPPATGVKPLQMHVSRLRDSLGDMLGARLRTTTSGYLLRAEEQELDSGVLAAALRGARCRAGRGDHQGVLDELLPALGLWQGRPFADVTESFRVGAAAVHIEENVVAALETRFQAELALGRHRVVLAALAEAAAQFPYHEGICGQRMTALYRSGRRPEALRAYRIFSERLEQDLQIRPSHALRWLEQQIRAETLGQAALPLPHWTGPRPDQIVSLPQARA